MSVTTFQRAGFVILDATGAGQVTISPTAGTWAITNTAVSVATSTKQPTARLYRGVVSPVNLLAASYTGANDSNNDRIILQQGTPLICVWTGGDVGARATMSITITQYTAPYAAPSE